MKTLVIKESKWLQGKPEYSYLLNDKGEMCCLGFLGKACGATDKQLLGIGNPSGTSKVKWVKGLRKWLAYGNGFASTDLCRDIIQTNDTPQYTLEERKLALRPLFKKIGIALRFVK